jgi:hypothetical protein
VNRVTYQIALDENGKRFGEAMNGKRAAVIGRVSGEGEVRSLAVERFEEIKKGAEPQETKTSTPPRRRSGTTRRTTRRGGR